MNNTKELRFVELVLNPCSRTYGSSPCTASLGVTGDFKCYNSPSTCQDPNNYLAGEDQIVRWAMPTSDLPIDVEAMPCVTGISRRPQVIEAGEGLGVRESVSVSMNNFRHNDAGFDKYIADRGYNTYNKGTYWGKFNARWNSLEGYEFRTIDGYEGQALEDMTYRYYVVESTSGPDANGLFSINAKDVITFMDSDKAQWPLPSEGVLSAAITTATTVFTLSPIGVGDAFYPASGVASISDEKVTFTRVGNTITLTGRGLDGSKLDDHDEGATFQLAATYYGQDPATIIRDLLQDATDVPSDYIDYDAWKEEVDNFLARLYSAEIMQPTPVRTLIEELVQEAGLTIYTDLERKKIAIKVLRQEVPTQLVTDDFIVAGSISRANLESKRISDVWIYYGKKNPLEKRSEWQNYAAVYAKSSSNAVAALNNNPSAIREVHSRWITITNSDAAFSIADRMIARYQSIPRQVSFKIPNSYNISLGNQFTIQSRIFENSQGDLADPINCQITSIENANGIYSAIGEEVIFGEVEPSDPSLRIVSINADLYNLNLRDAHDLIYTPIESGQTVRLLVGSGVKIGSENDDAALIIGDWPAGVIVEIGGSGRIQGKGGKGGSGGSPVQDGGDAIYTRYNINIISDLEIWGGGGGGGNGTKIVGGTFRFYVGGGGAGFTPGERGGTTEAGGPALVNAGYGGGPGIEGADGLDEDPGGDIITLGGAAGNWVDGYSYVTLTGAPDTRGQRIN